VKRTLCAVALLTLSGCGGSDGGSTGSALGTANGGATTTPPPTPTPPPPAYVKYANLTGNQTFQSACATNGSGATAFSTAYGGGPALVYTATTNSYLVSGNGITSSFGPADADPAASAGSKSYRKVVNTIPERLSIGPLKAAGTALEYTHRRGSFTELYHRRTDRRWGRAYRNEHPVRARFRQWRRLRC
jgi:hypothetical protein